MQNISDAATLEQMKTEAAVFVLFGGAHCNVCHSLRPQLQAMLDQHFTEMHAVYVDCGISAELCAHHGVFSLPAVKVFIEGMLVVEAARVFSIRELMQRIQRPYTMWLDARGE